jgi:dephospho-CoA kinase
VENYGFESITDGPISIFSANNYIFSQQVDPNFFNDALIIAVDADDDTRLERLTDRSPDLIEKKPIEIAKRMSASLDDILTQSHFVLNNSKAQQTISL